MLVFFFTLFLSQSITAFAQSSEFPCQTVTLAGDPYHHTGPNSELMGDYTLTSKIEPMFFASTDGASMIYKLSARGKPDLWCIGDPKAEFGDCGYYVGGEGWPGPEPSKTKTPAMLMGPIEAGVTLTCVNEDAGSPTGDAGSCFHASGAATLESGAQKKMPELKLGDVVQVADEEGKVSFSEILLLPHKKNDEPATFLNLTTESGKTTLMTPDHLIPRCGEMVILSMASELLVGDCLLTTDGKETLTEITSVVANGIYTAITKAKFIVVDSIIASPFSRDSDRDHSMREYEEFRIVLEKKQKLELDKAERKQQTVATKLLDTGN